MTGLVNKGVVSRIVVKKHRIYPMQWKQHHNNHRNSLLVLNTIE
ncbi:hypothetical protein [Volucribacter psittacicida]|nr:hypothetical protein [Volucribacter psittacicida]